MDHPEKAPEGQRFSVERLIADLRARGKDAVSIPGVPDIVDFLARESRRDDVILVMSNGAFGGLHDRLLGALATRR